MAKAKTPTAAGGQTGSSPRSEQKSSRWAAVDIGSDTVHLLVVEAHSTEDGWELRPLRRKMALLELGRDVARHGEIRPNTMRELRRLVPRFVESAHKLKAEVLLAATEACRTATNGQEVLREVAKATGAPVRLLSGAREAELGFLAIRSSLADTGCQLVIDSGGASTEVSVTEGRTRSASVSLPVGASALAEELRGDVPGSFRWALQAVSVGQSLAALPAAEPVQAWATGGSAHNLAGLERAEVRRQSRKLTTRALDKLFRELSRQPARRLARQSGEDPRRVRLLAPGALILGSVLNHYQLAGCTVLRAGVREGMIIAANKVGDSWWHDEPVLSSSAQPVRSPDLLLDGQ